MTRKLISTIVGDINNSCLTWLDGLLGKRGNGATATGKSLMDNQRSRAGILETETALNNRILLAELTKVVTQGIELNLGIVLSL